eukprot:COSAG04_NODE_104_length_26097_cov_12.466074_18_plen_110_part_00
MAIFAEGTSVWDDELTAVEPDLTPYQRLCEQLRQDRLLQQQVARHGDAEMRKAVSVPVSNADIPTDGFVRSYELKLPGQKSQKKKPPDPCARLLKAMAKASSAGGSGSK